jgi:hypothetical protein
VTIRYRGGGSDLCKHSWRLVTTSLSSALAIDPTFKKIRVLESSHVLNTIGTIESLDWQFSTSLRFAFQARLRLVDQNTNKIRPHSLSSKLSISRLWLHDQEWKPAHRTQGSLLWKLTTSSKTNCTNPSLFQTESSIIERTTLSMAHCLCITRDMHCHPHPPERLLSQETLTISYPSRIQNPNKNQLWRY